jgi:hypothetical protein
MTLHELVEHLFKCEITIFVRYLSEQGVVDHLLAVSFLLHQCLFNHLLLSN